MWRISLSLPRSLTALKKVVKEMLASELELLQEELNNKLDELEAMREQVANVQVTNCLLKPFFVFCFHGFVVWGSISY